MKLEVKKQNAMIDIQFRCGSCNRDLTDLMDMEIDEVKHLEDSKQVFVLVKTYSCSKCGDDSSELEQKAQDLQDEVESLEMRNRDLEDDLESMENERDKLSKELEEFKKGLGLG